MHLNRSTDEPCRRRQAHLAAGFGFAGLPLCGDNILQNPPATRYLCAKAIPIPPFGQLNFGVPQEDGFKFRSFARQTNFKANGRIIDLATKVLHQLHPDKCED